MADGPRALVEQIHDHEASGVFYVTGGGSGLLPTLLTVPGASATVLEAQVPYAEQALAELLGTEPEQACSEVTSRLLAMRAFVRARELGGVFGLGLTASLRSATPKRGDHRFHVALQTPTTTYSFSRTLPKDVASRDEEEATTADTALKVLAFALDLIEQPPLEGEIVSPGSEIERLLGEDICVVGEPARAIFPGAFNPLHDGHRRMRRIAEDLLDQPVTFELCVKNVDKPSIDFVEISRRAQQFEPGELILTNTPTFIEKARALATRERTTFVVGADTMVRIGQAHYYESPAGRDDAIHELTDLGCHFLVFGRDARDGFQSLSTLELPDPLRALATEVPEEVFREDISSSALRGRPET